MIKIDNARTDLQSMVIRNTAFLTLSQFLAKALGFINFIILARILGDAQFGEMSFALSYTGLFLVIAFMGLDTVVTRDLSQDRVYFSDFISQAVTLRATLTIAAFLLTIFSCFLFGYTRHLVFVIVLFGASSFIDFFSRVFFAVFRAQQDMRWEALYTFIEKVFILAGLIVCYYTQKGIYLVGIIYVVSMVIKTTTIWFTFKSKIMAIRLQIDMKKWGALLRTSMPFATVYIFWSISYRIDQVMLEAMKGVHDVGWYGAAYRIIETMTFIPDAVGAAFLPAIAFTVVSTPELVVGRIKDSLRFLLFISIGIAIPGTFFADKLILPLLGDAFLNSILVFQILVWSLIFIYSEFITSSVLIALHRQNALLWIMASCMSFNIAVNYFLIPQYGIIGAAISTILTEALNVSIAVVIIQTSLNRRILSWQLISFVGSGAAIGILFSFAQSVNWILLFCFGTLGYILFVFVSGGIRRSDYDNIMNAFIHRRSYENET